MFFYDVIQDNFKKKPSYFVRKSYYRGYLFEESYDWLINLASI